MIIIFWIISDSNNKKREALNILQKAEISINTNKIDEALILLKESKKLNPNKENDAYKLENEILKFKSKDF